MKNIIQNFNEWCYRNLDLVEETLEKGKKTVVLIAGASSSGKSYAANALKEFLEKRGHTCCSLSTDSYNKGISGIIADKVNSHMFQDSVSDISDMKKIIRQVITNSDFDKKFCDENINAIKQQFVQNKISIVENPVKLNLFLQSLVTEFAKINFDEVTVYSLPEIAQDIKELFQNKVITKKEYSKVISERLPSQQNLNGADYDVIIVEGIYALNQLLVDSLALQKPVCDFVDSDNKTLFLRRVLRDKKITSLDNSATIKMYFEKVVPEYKNTVLPTRKNADLVLKNPITFDELRHGELYSNQIKLKIDNPSCLAPLIQSAEKVTTRYERDLLFSDRFDPSGDENILRVRTVSPNGKDYKLFSLIHKGPIKARKDRQVIRPINILIDDGKLSDCYRNETELIDAFEKADLIVSKISLKKRTRLTIQGEKLSINELQNGEVYLEYDGARRKEIAKILKEIPLCSTELK